jgi:hypothetical protein
LAKARCRCATNATLNVYDGLNHGFIRYRRLIGSARRALADGAAASHRGLAVYSRRLAAAPASAGVERDIGRIEARWAQPVDRALRPTGAASRKSPISG